MDRKAVREGSKEAESFHLASALGRRQTAGPNNLFMSN